MKVQYPLDEAMANAVGGDYQKVGQIERNILLAAGLRPGMSIFDLGCGSGRLAAALSNEQMPLQCLGTDVVQDLLDYAASKTPNHFSYIRTANCPSLLNLPV
jgi:ubiquinone/menaquinone biosynthesis C-methylase UbiE